VSMSTKLVKLAQQMHNYIHILAAGLPLLSTSLACGMSWRLCQAPLSSCWWELLIRHVLRPAGCVHVLHTAVEARSASCSAKSALRGKVIQFGGISCLYAAMRNEHLPAALIDEPLTCVGMHVSIVHNHAVVPAAAVRQQSSCPLVVSCSNLKLDSKHLYFR
jgi:hypothetical protein